MEEKKKWQLFEENQAKIITKNNSFQNLRQLKSCAKNRNNETKKTNHMVKILVVQQLKQSIKDQRKKMKSMLKIINLGR